MTILTFKMMMVLTHQLLEELHRKRNQRNEASKIAQSEELELHFWSFGQPSFYFSLRFFYTICAFYPVGWVSVKLCVCYMVSGCVKLYVS